jgi:hypothetical protein
VDSAVAAALVRVAVPAPGWRALVLAALALAWPALGRAVLAVLAARAALACAEPVALACAEPVALACAVPVAHGCADRPDT